MFQYTTETIINKNVGNFNGKRFDTIKQSTGVHESTDNDAILIDGVALLLKNDKGAKISKIYRRCYKPSVNESLKITVVAPGSTDPLYAKGDVLRLAIKTRQEGIVSSIYKDSYRVSKKPFFYEIVCPASVTAANVASLFADAITKEMAMTDFNFFKASANGADLTLTADDCYTRFEVVNIAKVPSADITTENFGSALTGFEDYDVLMAWKRADGDVASKFDITEGTEGAGTVARLIKNLRVPTDANVNPFAPDMGGKPVPDGKYDEWVIEYESERRHIGGQVVGALDKSLTTHIIFANDGADAAASTLTTGVSADLYKALVTELGLSLADDKIA